MKTSSESFAKTNPDEIEVFMSKKFIENGSGVFSFSSSGNISFTIQGTKMTEDCSSSIFKELETLI